jgi:ubiquinone/menaquinone biosynthesis C-methylase UbiE
VDRLEGTAELLDGPLHDRAALEANLRDIVRLNRLLGGASLSRRCLLRLAAGEKALSLLDVGTGAADVAVALVEGARRHGLELRVTAVDNRAEVIDAAPRANPALARATGVTLEVADGTALPWPDDSWDVAHASLVLHHFEPDAAVTFLAELGRVARRGVIVNDLTRGRRYWLVAWLLTRLIARGRYTRHDGPLSVRRAYTAREARELLGRAGLRPVVQVHALGGHRWAVGAVPERR